MSELKMTLKQMEQLDNRTCMTHCNQGEYEGSCKYGRSNCPACVEGTPKKVKTRDKVLNLLKEKNDWMTPTELGMKLGKDYGSASSFTSSHLKKLEELGLVERNKAGHARIK